MKYGIMLMGCLFIGTVVFAQSNPKRKLIKGTYEEVDFEDMMHRYFGKEAPDPLEGIYSVSCVITKRNKKFLSRNERFRVVERKDNYARIAILRDWPTSKRDYIEVSLSYRDAKKYPIVGELSVIAEGSYIYRHFEPDMVPVDFSMIRESDELIEGEYSEVHKRRTITYKLSYLKIYPKESDLTVYRN